MMNWIFFGLGFILLVASRLLDGDSAMTAAGIVGIIGAFIYED